MFISIRTIFGNRSRAISTLRDVMEDPPTKPRTLTFSASKYASFNPAEEELPTKTKSGTGPWT